MLTFKVLGSGCANCHKVEELAKQAVAQSLSARGSPPRLDAIALDTFCNSPSIALSLLLFKRVIMSRNLPFASVKLVETWL